MFQVYDNIIQYLTQS